MAYFRYPSGGDKKTVHDRQLVSQSHQKCSQHSQHLHRENISEDQAQLLYLFLMSTIKNYFVNYENAVCRTSILCDYLVVLVNFIIPHIRPN